MCPWADFAGSRTRPASRWACADRTRPRPVVVRRSGVCRLPRSVAVGTAVGGSTCTGRDSPPRPQLPP
ncbi:hypothetical protein EW053_33620 [Streptomyces sp. IB2014 016-6]|nr:hypothetical protein EW053_33620 [Streptomyces sp. IB2014 016-6]